MFKNTSSSVHPSMPILEHVKRVFQAEFGHDFSKLPNRHTTLFVIVQHGFVTIRPMMDIFLEMGIPSDHIFMTTKPHTTSPDMLAYFQETFGTHYIPFQWSAADSTVEHPSPYKRLTTLTHDRLFEKFCDYLLCYPAPAHIKNIIICDEGGKFLNAFIERYHNPDNQYLKKLSDYHVVAIEHTKCGTYSEALRRLPFPLVNMADSYLKTRIESEFIAKSMFVNLQSVLTRLVDSSQVTIGVVGAGNIGREVLYFLFREYPTASIIIYDHEPSALSQAKITENGWRNVSRADSIQSLFQQATIILGCTGKDITTTLSLDAIAENPANQLHLISCSSGDAEFQTLLQRMPNYRFENLADIRDWTMPLNTSGEKQLTIYNGGFPMNFLVEQGIPAPESVPLQEVQVTRSMKLAALVQALKLLEVTSYTSEENSLTGYMQLDMFYQWEIIQALYLDLISGASSEKQTRVQEQYARITKKEIIQGSVGTQQPSMSSVFKIPHYVITHYQIRVEQQLFNQQRPIKLLVINGTTGSGKTTLAQHYLQKQRIQNPKHLHRTLLAETTAQWRSQLRDWAEELFPELNALIKAETDPKRQERMVNEHIQRALEKTPWCVVVDNWDQNALPIIEIEKLFLNSDIDVGKGILLITTQGQSPYGQAQSIDLSQGFAADESKGLLIKVMNLEEELAITWDGLGSDANLQALTRFLNHLPLAVVLAGSYLMWENKSRRSENKPLFTFIDYQQLLKQHVAELIRAHDEQLGSRGNIPREDRKEFMRVKTQEATVDLSLKKAIQIDSRNPNMNLWQMLCFCGFLASDGIPQQLLKDYISQILPEDEREIHETFFEMLLSEAQKYSLLQFENKLSAVDHLNGLHMHRVIQKILREKYWSRLLQEGIVDGHEFKWASTRKTERLIPAPMVLALYDSLHIAVSKEKTTIIRAYLSHAKEWLRYFQEILKTEKLNTLETDLQSSLAHAHKILGDYSQAKKLYHTALTTKIMHYRTEAHIKVADAQENLAIVLEQLGDYIQAEQLYRASLATKITHYGTEAHIDVAMTQQNLAIVLHQLGFYIQAEQLYRTALTTMIAHYGTETHINVAETQENLAGTLLQLGDYVQVEQLYRASLAIKITHYGTEAHIKVADAQQNLALVLNKLGNRDQAVKLYRTTLATMISHYGTEMNIRVAEVQQNLAVVMEQLNDHISSEKLMRAALATKITHYGTEAHVKVAETQQNLAIVMKNLGDYIQAETLYRAALETKRIHYGTEAHIETALTQYNFAKLLIHLNKNREALLLIEKAENVFKTQAGMNQELNYCYQLKESLMRQLISKRQAHDVLVMQSHEESVLYFTAQIYFNPNNRSYYHNIACAYHLWGIQTGNIDHFNQAKHYFEHALRLKKAMNTTVEYANFLRERGSYSEAITLLDETIGQPSDNPGRLSYDLGELPALPPALAEKIKEEGAITIHHPQFFAYYLKIACFVEIQAATEEIEACLVQFTDYLMNFYQTNPEVPIYDWLLENAFTLQEKEISTNTSLPFFETRNDQLDSIIRQGKSYNH